MTEKWSVDLCFSFVIRDRNVRKKCKDMIDNSAFDNSPHVPRLRVMVFGVGAFTQSVLHTLKRHGAEVSTYLIRDYGHYSPGLEGQTYSAKEFPNPCKLLQKREIDLIIPMSIDWI
ncbi:MAG: hypothetical protein ACE5DO_11830, partial [Desulfobacterales bacterium]